MHTISTRAITSDELSRLKRQFTLTSNGIAWIVFPLGGLAAAGFFVGKLLDWIASKMGFYTGSLLAMSLMSLMGCLGLVLSIFMCRGYVRQQKDRRSEIRDNVVEIIHIEDAKAVRIGREDGDSPMVVFDIGDNKLLCLLGQWMWDPAIFEPCGSDSQFPSDSFCIARLPESGNVLRVQVLGKSLGQLREATLENIGLTKRKIEDFRECVIFEGQLASPSTSG